MSPWGMESPRLMLEASYEESHSPLLSSLTGEPDVDYKESIKCLSMPSSPSSVHSLTSQSTELLVELRSIKDGEETDSEDEARQPEEEYFAELPSSPATLMANSQPSWSYKHIKLSAERLQTYITRYGGRCFAYNHLHHCHYHFEVAGLGVVSYASVWSITGWAVVVVTDPLVAPENMKKLLECFHATVPGMISYIAVSQMVAEALSELGYSTTVFGQDYYADLQEWKLPKKNSLQRYRKQGRNEGLVVKEQKWADVDASRVQEISNAWLQTKGMGHELQLMTWPYYEGDEWASRKFYCYDADGQMLAFMWFIPCFRDNKVVGYCANILRRDPNIKKTYVLDYLIMCCAEQFRDEGIEYLALAPAVLHGLDGCDNELFGVRLAFKLIYNVGDNIIYSFQGLGARKDHFKVNRVEKLYACAAGVRANIGMCQLALTVTNCIPVAGYLHGITSYPAEHPITKAASLSQFPDWLVAMYLLLFIRLLLCP